MEPIIAPSFFYWINVVNEIKYLFMILPAACFAVIGFVAWLSYDFMDSYHQNEKDKKMARKIALVPKIIKGGLVALLLLSIGLFIPTRTILIQMEIAKHITKDNVKVMLKYGDEFRKVIKADIIDVIDSVTKPKED